MEFFCGVLKTYGILLWGFENKSIFKLQKKAVRIITKSHFLAHTDPIFKREKILKVEDIFNVSCLKLYYKFVNNQLPTNIKKLFNFNNSRPINTVNPVFNYNLIHYNCNDAYGKKRIRYHLPKLIHDTEIDILRKTRSLSLIGFKSVLKTYFLSKYDDSICQDLNCYSCNSMLMHHAVIQNFP